MVRVVLSMDDIPHDPSRLHIHTKVMQASVHQLMEPQRQWPKLESPKPEAITIITLSVFLGFGFKAWVLRLGSEFRVFSLGFWLQDLLFQVGRQLFSEGICAPHPGGSARFAPV